MRRRVLSISLLLVILPVFLASALWAMPASASVTATITANAASVGNSCEGTGTSDLCPAPLAVYFDGASSTCSTTECDNSPFDRESWHKLYYVWNFGDPASGTWQYSGQSRNVEYGPEAGHVFDPIATGKAMNANCGDGANTCWSYTVTLNVYSDSETDSDSVTIYVDDPEDVWDTNTICIYDSGSSLGTGCPDATYTAESDDFDNVIASNISTGCGGGGCRRFLFKHSDEFTLSTSTLISVEGPAMIGSYGGVYGVDKAAVDATGCGGSCAIFDASSVVPDDWRLMDLEIEHSPTPVTGQGLIYYDGSPDPIENSLVYRIDQTEGDTFITALRTEGSIPQWFEATDALFVFDSTATGIHTYGFFGCVSYGSYMGNSIQGDNESATGEHILRFSGCRWDHMLFAHNRSWGAMYKADNIRCRNDSDTICQYFSFRANLIEPTVTNGFDWFAVRVAATDQVAYMRDVLIENNRFWVPLLLSSAKRITARNNVILSGVSSGQTAGIKLNPQATCSLDAGWVDWHMVYNNSIYGDGSSDDGIRVTDDQCGGPGAQMADNYLIYNNLFYNSNGAAVAYECNDLGNDTGFDCVDDVTRADNVDATSNPYDVPVPSEEVNSNWYLRGAGASQAINQGTDVGAIAYADFEANIRDDQGQDVGAFDESAGRIGSTGIKLTGGSIQ